MTEQRKQLDFSFQVKEVKEDGVFEGYGSVFNIQDSYRDIVMPGAFAESLAKHKTKGSMPALLWQHQPSEPIGVWEEMKEDETGLFVRGKLLIDDDPLARRAYAHLKAGSISGLSIGFMTLVDEWDREAKVNRLKKVDLWETSIVTFPANDAARVQAVKALEHITNIREFEAVLRDELGFTTKQAKKIASGGWPALNERDVRGDELEATVNSVDRLLSIIQP